MSEAFNPIDGTRIAYQQAGEGEPLLLVHGSGLSRAMWRGLGYVAALKAAFQLILVDVRGHGLSGKPHEQSAYRMPLVLGDLLAVLDAAGVASAHYFGYSFGARAGFSLASTHPDRIRSFVAAGGTYRSTSGAIGQLFLPGFAEALESGGMPGFIDGWEAHSGGRLDAATRTAFLANDPAALLAYFRQVEVEEGLDEQQVRGLTASTLLLAGTDDRQRHRDSERAAELMPDARFVSLPGRNHGTTLIPSAGVVEPVREFLLAHRAAAG